MRNGMIKQNCPLLGKNFPKSGRARERIRMRDEE
jgi:hypothetical protein